MEDIYCSHYGQPFTMNHNCLNKFGLWAAATIADIMCELEKRPNMPDIFPVIAYSGMSGVSLATITMSMLQMKHAAIYVRKEDEKTHGRNVEMCTDVNFEMSADGYTFKQNKVGILFIIDDFVDSCKTVKYILEKLDSCRPDNRDLTKMIDKKNVNLLLIAKHGPTKEFDVKYLINDTVNFTDYYLNQNNYNSKFI